MKNVSVSRLERGNRTTKELGISNGDFNANAFKSAWRINQNEYEYINRVATDKEMLLLLSDEENISFSDAKKAVLLMENFMEKYQETHT